MLLVSARAKEWPKRVVDALLDVPQPCTGSAEEYANGECHAFAVVCNRLLYGLGFIP
jgi:xanthine dehydrogenase iron-sulfur cluster and FAD-binding subunit A